MDNYKQSESAFTRIQATMCDKQTVTEISSDFTLPDYQPEIKRLLRVRATPLPPDKYIGAGNVEFSGSIDYSILYSANDGAVYCTYQTGEYQFSVPLEASADFDIGDGLLCDVRLTPDTCVGRVMAPRKLSIKCRLRSRVHLLGTRLIEEHLTCGAEASVERLRKSAECMRQFLGLGEEFLLGDEILFDAQTEALRVICAEGQVVVNEAVAGSGIVNCHGEVILKLLCVREAEGQLPTIQWRKIPFSQSIPTDGVEINCDCSARGTCNRLNISVEEGRIVCEVGVRLEVCARRNEMLSYTKDAYSTLCDGEVKRQSYVLPCSQKNISGNFSLNTMLSMDEAGVREGQEIVDATLLPSVTSLECENGKYLLSGRCRCHIILMGESDWSSQEFEIPFRYECDGAAEAPFDYEVDVIPLSCRVRMDGERIGIDGELAVNLCTRGKNEIVALTEGRFDTELCKPASAYTVCYPAKEDTLWSVAKRYHTSVNALAEKNPLPPTPSADAADSLGGVSYLLV